MASLLLAASPRVVGYICTSTMEQRNKLNCRMLPAKNRFDIFIGSNGVKCGLQWNFTRFQLNLICCEACLDVSSSSPMKWCTVVSLCYNITSVLWNVCCETWAGCSHSKSKSKYLNRTPKHTVHEILCTVSL